VVLSWFMFSWFYLPCTSCERIPIPSFSFIGFLFIKGNVFWASLKAQINFHNIWLHTSSKILCISFYLCKWKLMLFNKLSLKTKQFEKSCLNVNFNKFANFFKYPKTFMEMLQSFVFIYTTGSIKLSLKCS